MGSVLGEAGVSGSAEDLVNLWWSRYCTACGGHFPLSETECPHDGTSLRDLSISTMASFLIRTGGPLDTGGGQAFESGLMPPGPEAAQGELSPFHPGKLLGGKWRLDQELGGGGFGRFWLAKHKELGMKAGVKILRRRFTAGSLGRRLFYAECMKLSRLNHPNIVKVHDCGEEDDQPYLVMEFLTGKPLHKYLGEQVLSLDEGVDIIRQVALALVAAYKGADTGGALVHLDLKPEHIFLERPGGGWHAKVIDFGIAEIASAPATNGDSKAHDPAEKRVAGTLPYMAPERWEGVVDPRCDIYSLGVILYEIVAGRKPFIACGPDAWEVMREMHKSAVPPPPSHARMGRSKAPLKELDSIILRCLEKRPEDRPQDAEVLAEQLERWLSRPRLSTTQRVARAIVPPVIAVLIVVMLTFLALLAFAPGKVVHNAPKPALLGPETGPVEATVTTSGLVSALGGELYLVLEKDNQTWEWPLKRDPDGESGVVVLAWETVRKAVGEALTDDSGEARADGKWQARFKLRSWVGRSILSDPFGLRIDSLPPNMVGERPDGDVLKSETGGELVLYSQGFLRIEADEDLDDRLDNKGCCLKLSKCGDGSEQLPPGPIDVNGRTVQSQVEKTAPIVDVSGRTVQFQVERAALTDVSGKAVQLEGKGEQVPEEVICLFVTLCDKAGNRLEYRLGPARWMKDPVPEFEGAQISGKIFTNERDYQLRVWIPMPHGKVRIKWGEADDEKDVAPTKDEKTGVIRSPYDKKIRFRPGKEPDKQPRRVTVFAQTEFTAKGDGTLYQEIGGITVEYCRRDLQVVPVEGKKGLEITGFELLCGGKPVVDPPEEARATVWSYNLELDGTTLKAGIEAAPTLEINVRKILEGKRGKVYLWVQARDVYGNPALPSDSYSQWFQIGLTPPNLKSLACGEGRSLESPLLHEDCPLRQENKVPASLTLRYELEYGYEVAAELRINDKPLTGRPYFLKPGQSQLPVELTDIYDYLKVGPNELYLQVTDKDSRFQDFTGRNEEPCVLYYAAPLKVEVKPSPGVLPGSPVDIAVRVTGGPPKASRVLVGGQRARQKEKATGEWILDSKEIHLAGLTAADVTIQFELDGDSWKYTKPVTYSREFVNGEQYRYAVGGILRELVVVFSKGQRGQSGVLYTPLAECRRLVEAFRRSKKGEDAEAMHPKGVTQTEADQVARWVWGQAKEYVSFEDAPETVRQLPSLKDLTALLDDPAVWKKELADLKEDPEVQTKDVPKCEWIRFDENDPRLRGHARFKALCVETKKTGETVELSPLGHGKDSPNLFPFRLIFPVGRTPTKFAPSNAMPRDAETVHEGRKAENDGE